MDDCVLFSFYADHFLRFMKITSLAITTLKSGLQLQKLFNPLMLCVLILYISGELMVFSFLQRRCRLWTTAYYAMFLNLKIL